MAEKNHQFDVVKLNELYKTLNEKYPDVINKKQVLANSIANEIHQALKIKVKEAEEFCVWYKGLHYKKLLIEGAGKVNLKGQVIGVVTRQEADKAKEYIEKKQRYIFPPNIFHFSMLALSHRKTKTPTPIR